MQPHPRHGDEHGDGDGAAGHAGKRPADSSVEKPISRRATTGPPASIRKPRADRGDRVSKACTNCRQRKTKCSGTQPCCTICKTQGLDCDYELPRKDRLKEAIDHNELLASLLGDVSSRLDHDDRARIEEALGHAALSRQSKRPKHQPSRSDDQHQHGRDDAPSTGEAQPLPSPASDQDPELMELPVLRDVQAGKIGYVGYSSGVYWLKTLEHRMKRQDGEPQHVTQGPPAHGDEPSSQRTKAPNQRQSSSQLPWRAHLKDYYFFLDHDDSTMDMDIGNPDILPPFETAERLLHVYKEKVHTPFRILDTSFEDQLRGYYRVVEAGGTITIHDRWKAVANLVFAIASRYSHLVGAKWRAADHDHLVYMRRAVRLLGASDFTALTSAPDLILIQATGLLAFYYLTIGHVSKAWFTVGISIRYAQAVGLHLNNQDPSLSRIKKTATGQLWWGLHSIECILTSVTGRPRLINAKECTVALPAYGVEERPEPSGLTGNASKRAKVVTDFDSFLQAYTDLDIIMQNTLSNLYYARNANQSWTQVQQTISSLTESLDAWCLKRLPNGTSAKASDAEPEMGREQVLLLFFYNSTRIIIARPCLCRLDQNIKGQSEDSAKFDQRTAEACVQAARDLASLLPHQPNLPWLYKQGPWWSNVHNIVQALTVLLLDSLLRPTDSTTTKPDNESHIAKLVRWLESMAHNDAVSARAHKIVTRVLNKDRLTIKGDLPDATRKRHDNEPTSTSDPRYANPATSSQAAFSTYNSPSMPLEAPSQTDAGPSTRPEHSRRHPPFEDDFYAQANAGNFDLRQQNIYFDFSGSQAVGRAQMSLVFDGQHPANFTQLMEDPWPATNFDDWAFPDEPSQSQR